jgi:hypothetical protein
MTAENSTRTTTQDRTIFRRRLPDSHNNTARTMQTSAAIRVGNGALCRIAIAHASPRALWCVKGRMMNAGMKKKAIAAMDDIQKINQTDKRAEFEDGMAMAFLHNLIPHCSEPV